VHIRGALHVHSKLSHDGTLSIEELAHWYKRKGYQFLAMGEHAEDLDEAKVQALRELSTVASDDEFCVVPGIEFAVTNAIHIVGIGLVSLIREKDPVAVAAKIHELGGFAILAHPKRLRWECPSELLRAVDAAEIWNVGYDGKYLPSPKALGAFRRMQQANPKLLAAASHDFHRAASFYDVSIEMEVSSLSSSAILRKLQQGGYDICSRFFRTDSKAQMSRFKAASISLLSRQLTDLKKLRSAFLRSTAS
jgi:hypothetical protein